MFIFLKPDAQVDDWFNHLRPFGPLTCYPRKKSESWSKRFYSHIPEEAKERNAKFIASGWLIGMDLDIGCFNFATVARKLRSLRTNNPKHKERNQIHVPDNQTHSDEGREAFLDTK